MSSGKLQYSSESGVISGSGVCKCYNPRLFNGHGDDATPENKTRHARFPHPNPPPEGEGTTDSRLTSREDLYDAIMEGAVERVRPKMMTVVAIMAGLLPIMWGTGTGSEVMSRIAAPMVGGMISSTVLTLAVIPAIYALVKQWRLARGLETS